MRALKSAIPAALLCLVLAAGAALAQAAVDPRLVGLWERAIAGEQGEGRLVVRIDANGTMTMRVERGANWPDEVGQIQAANGRYVYRRGDGQTEEGTYRLPDSNTLLIQGGGAGEARSYRRTGR